MQSDKNKKGTKNVQRDYQLRSKYQQKVNVTPQTFGSTTKEPMNQRNSLPQNGNTKFGSKFFVGKLKSDIYALEQTTTMATDIYTKYTASSSFRNIVGNTESSTADRFRSTFGHKFL